MTRARRLGGVPERRLGLALGLGLAACGSTVGGHTRPTDGAGVGAPVVAPSELASASASSAPEALRLEGDPLVTLDVEGFLPAYLSIPTGAAEPRPIVVVVHGNGDRSEWQCQVWAGIFRRTAFLLCPTGKLGGESSPGDPRYTFTDHLSLEREIDAGLAALRASRFAPWLRTEPPVYAGFSLGAMMGISIASHRASDFPTMILVEGGLEKLTDHQLEKFVTAGGKRIMFGCSEGRACADACKLFADRLTFHGGQGAHVYAGPVGHRYDGAVAEAISAALPGFLGGDPHWKALLPEQ